MKRKIIVTADGSKSIHLPEWNEQYHSKHGAIQEANHVFINAGLHFYLSKNKYVNPQISILEIGFGTGLNAFLTFLETEKNNVAINYIGVEAYPVIFEEVKQLNYTANFAKEIQSSFLQMHQEEWDKTVKLGANFTLKKRKQFFLDITDKNTFDIIYFDAFGARVQPELWTEAVFLKMYNALRQGGILVTYSAKGSARRAMQSVGFLVEKIPGPPGKREMLRAKKI